ncbi:hypothetical protein AAZX31_01G161700 [Glycine max]
MSSADKNANGQQFMENGDSHRRLNKSLLCLVMLGSSFSFYTYFQEDVSVLLELILKSKTVKRFGKS